jgi:hypothetical protein
MTATTAGAARQQQERDASRRARQSMLGARCPDGRMADERGAGGLTRLTSRGGGNLADMTPVCRGRGVALDGLITPASGTQRPGLRPRASGHLGFSGARASAGA